MVEQAHARITKCTIILYGTKLSLETLAGEWPSDTRCQYWALVGKLFKIGIPKFRETCRLASRLAHAPSLKGNSVTGHVFTMELNYLLWRRLLHLHSVKLLNTNKWKTFNVSLCFFLRMGINEILENVSILLVPVLE